MNLFNQAQDLSDELVHLLTHSNIIDTHPSLKTYLDTEKIPVTSTEYATIQTQLLDSIKTQTDYFCHLVYFIMTKTNQWGDSGEDQVKTSFCRNLLQMPADEAIDYAHIMSFNTLIEEKQTQHKIKSLSITKAKKKFDAFEFKIGNESIPLHDCHKITKILQFCGINKILQGGYYGQDKEIILGEGTLEKCADYDIIYIQKEDHRTPNTVVSMVAIIGDKQIYLRHEAMNTIFKQKWLPVLNPLATSFRNQSDAHKISEGIKQLALHHYDIKTENDTQKNKNMIISDLLTTIKHHELGHGIIQYHLFEKEIGAFSEATKIFGETIFSSLLELLAELAPHHNSLKGPLAYLCQVAQTDPKHATAMFYTYFSDAWFFDTEDTHMYEYSNIICLFLSQFIKEDYSLDFNQLTTQLDIQTPQNITQWIIELVTHHVQDLIPVFQKASYKIKKKKYSFERLQKLIQDDIEKHFKTVEYDSYQYYTCFWSQVFEYYLEKPANKTFIMKKFQALSTSICTQYFTKITQQHLQDASDFQSGLESVLIKKNIDSFFIL